MQVQQDEVSKAESAIESLVPSVPNRTLNFKLMAYDGQMVDREYTQDVLGFFPVQEFTTMLSRIIKNFVDGEYGIKIGELFRGDVQSQLPQMNKMTPEEMAAKAEEMVDQNQQLIMAFFKLTEIVPDFQQDIIALSLGVLRQEREWFKGAISEPPSRGGLTIDEGFDILNMFIEQNASEIRRFFAEKGRELVDKFRLEVLDQDPSKDDSSESSTETSAPPEADTPTRGGMPSSISSPTTPVSV